MNILLIQERGRHPTNREFREALSMQRALQSLGHIAMVWGLGYPWYSRPIHEVAAGFDAIFLMEQYDQAGWVPDISGFKGPRVYWSIDDHCNGGTTPRTVQAQKITHILCSSERYLYHPAYEGLTRVWFPNCYDDTLIHPMPEVSKVHPVGFCGNLNNRGPWLDVIDEYHRSIGREPVKRDIFVIGHAMVEAISSYLIHFNRNIADDLNYRTFETLGAGTFILTNNTPGLDLMFDVGKEIVSYDSGEDLLLKINYYLQHPEEREAIAAAGYARVKRDHTYKARAARLVEILHG